MSEMQDLYQQLILDHNQSPHNRGPLEDASHHARGDNPLCGDQVTVHVRMDGDRVAAVRFEGRGCAISTASASLMTDAINGLSRDEAEAIVARFRALVTARPDEPVDEDGLGKLAALGGVRRYPNRVKCATLAWHTLLAALHDEREKVSTE